MTSELKVESYFLVLVVRKAFHGKDRIEKRFKNEVYKVLSSQELTFMYTE